MFTHNNPSLSSINSDELGWLDAYTHILQEQPLQSESSSSLSTGKKPNFLSDLSTPCNDSILLPLSKGSPRRHHYQRSTKSSSAKVVVVPATTKRSPTGLAARRPNHPNLRSSVTSPTPLSTPSLSGSSLSSASVQSSPIDTIPDTPRHTTKRCHSPTSTPPHSPEWIYRRPKSPCTPSSSSVSSSIRKRPGINRSASESSATSINYFADDSQNGPHSPFLTALAASSSYSTTTPPESPALWTALLRPRKKSNKNKTADIPSLWFGADDGVGVLGSSLGRKSSMSGARLREKKCNPAVLTTPPQVLLPKSPSLLSFGGDSLASTSTSIYGTSRRMQRSRSSSVSSSVSSMSTATTATTSSQPSTPTTPSFNSPSFFTSKKFKPHHTCIMEEQEPESEPEEKLPEEIGLRRKNMPSMEEVHPISASTPLPGTLLSSYQPYQRRKLKLSCTTAASSSKSVKFVETPTVHYASGGYEPDFWHVPGESMDTDDDMGIDVDSMDMGEPRSEEHPYARSVKMDIDSGAAFASDVSATYRPEDREMMCITPTPERIGGRGLKRIVPKGLKSKRSSTHQPHSSSPSRSITPRPAISGPFALGSTHLHSHAHGAPPGATPPPSLSSSHSRTQVRHSRPYGEGSGIALRSAPSLESFRSAKSSGAKSTRSLRSLRSLKSLPESVKSGLSVGAREMKEWFKGRVSINAL